MNEMRLGCSTQKGGGGAEIGLEDRDTGVGACADF